MAVARMQSIEKFNAAWWHWHADVTGFDVDSPHSLIEGQVVLTARDTRRKNPHLRLRCGRLGCRLVVL